MRLPSHPAKGSPAAYAWARKMKALRDRAKTADGYVRGYDLMKRTKMKGVYGQRGKNPRERGVDATGARELYLYATNNEALYRSREIPIIKNLLKKWNKGTYDHARAKDLWVYWADDAAQRYAKEFGSPGVPWHKMFNPATRYAVAEERADFIKGEFELGNYQLNPGAKWHESKAKEADQLDRAAHKKWQQDFYHGKSVAHSESALAAKSMGINPPVRPGDRVTFTDRFGKQRTGRAVFVYPTHLTLNMGGAHGTPQVIHWDQIVKVSSSHSNPRRRRYVIRKGDRVGIHAWKSEPGKGLSYHRFYGVLLDDPGSGWDVVDIRGDDGIERSVYSFSIYWLDPRMKRERGETNPKHIREWVVWDWKNETPIQKIFKTARSAQQVADTLNRQYPMKSPFPRYTIISAASARQAGFTLKPTDNPRRPPKRWFRSCVRQVARKSPRVRDPNAVCGSLWHQKASPSAKREAMQRERKNPIAIYGLSGNPSRNGHVSARIAGVIYNRVVEVKAQKTTFQPGYYRHTFPKKSQVQIFGLDNGDLLLHSKVGVKLWKPA